MAKKDNDEKKIIVDEDWKDQAQKEKEELAKEVEAEKETKEKDQGQRQLPPADFSGLVSMLTTQAFFALGLLEIQGQEGEEREPDLAMAKYNIDMLETLQEKTKGNLTPEEEKVLSNMINQLRMAYVKVAGQGQATE